MKCWNQRVRVVLVALSALYVSGLQAGHNDTAYAVTITNITKGEIFTPIMVASHKYGVSLFELGSPASGELEILAESGNNVPLSESLLENGALDVVSTEGGLPPGQSVTLFVKTNRHYNRVSVASMLVPTNDAFFAVNGIRGPKKMHRTKTVMSPAYDAGTEINDEMCVSIPGPAFICTGEGHNEEGGEGYVYIHSGIHGIADLNEAAHDWRNPVAKITIRKVRVED